MKTILRNSLKLALAVLLVVAFIGAGFSPVGRAAAACSPTVNLDLYAKTGSAVLYGATSVTIWGYSSGPSGATDPAALPGPVLTVTQGDCVQVTLHNTLSEASALNFQGQSLVPDTTGAPAGGTQVYTFVASNPGTFLYEAGLIPGSQHQVAMGLYGALVVNSSTSGSAYGTAATNFSASSTLVLSEVDPALNSSAAPASFDMRNYAPKYFLINGKAYTSGFSGDITITPGDTLLLRYVNAGLQAHAMSILGLAQSVIATTGRAYAHPHQMVAETIASGQTLDTLVSVPASAAGRYPLYDANLMLRNSAVSGLGGMLTFLTAGPVAPPSSGPLTSALTLSPNPSNGVGNVSISASVSDATTGGTGVSAAEFFLDAPGVNGTGTALTGSFGSPTVAVSATLSTASLSSGSHLIYVHGQDNLGWGSFFSTALILDKVGPTTSNVVITPNPSSGGTDISLTASASDSATGSSNITAAEYTIDGGTPVAMTVNSAAPNAGLSATISGPLVVNGLSEGSHTIAVRSQDALGNWGASVTATLNIDKTGPAASSVLANPNPNNGSKTFNTSNPSVRVTASFSDVASGNSNLAGAEGFIDTVAANGTGFTFIATDGIFNSPAETGFADVPIAVVGTLTPGNHTIYVHARDAAGNWGPTATVTLLIDKTAPTFTSVTLNPATIFQGSNTATFSVIGAADTGAAGLANSGQYWFDANAATAFSGSTSVPLATSALTVGTHTLNVRIADLAGNWSTTKTATLTVNLDAIFSDRFESPTTLPGNWSSRSTNNTTRLNNTTAASLAAPGTRGLQAQGNNPNYLQYNFGAAANPATASLDARFYFNPNNNASTGQVIFDTSSASPFGGSLFSVRYRRSGAQPQVQIQVGALPNASWVNINNNTSNLIEVVYQTAGLLQLYVNGSLAQTAAAAPTGAVSSFRLGSVTSGGSSTLMYFDQFAAKRSVAVLLAYTAALIDPPGGSSLIFLPSIGR